MARLLRLPVSTSDQDISLAQTQVSKDGHLSEPPARSRAQLAFDETRIGESSANGQVPKDSDLGLLETHISEDPQANKPARPRLEGGDEARMKALIKGKLFRTRTT